MWGPPDVAGREARETLRVAVDEGLSMMRAIVGTSIHFRFPMIAVAAVLVVVGVGQLRQMPVDVLPEFAPPYVEVQTEALGLSTDEVESLVSLNLEELLNGTPWLQSIHSRSVPGLSSLVLLFEPGTDVIRARQLVTERLSLAYTLPNVSKPPVILQPLSATSRVMLVGLSSRDTSLIDMSVLARWNIKPALLAVPGVANVSVWGMRERQLQVQVDPEQLRASDVTLDQIVEAAGDAVWVSPLTFLNASTPGSGGWIDTPQQRLEVRHDQPILEAGDLAKVAVGGTTLRLGDVAKVVEDHQPLIGDAVLKGGPGLLLVIEKFPGANTLEVTRGVEATLDGLKPGLRGITVDTSLFRPASFIDEAISNLSLVLIIGALLAILALGALLWDWRVALISLVAVALSLTAAGLVLYATGTTMNTMVLAGLVIALGLIIDDAIVDVGNIARRLRLLPRNVSDQTATQAIIDASLQMRRPLIYATLVMIVAISPVFFLQGIAGAFFGPLAFSYALAVAASLAVALSVTPALSFILLSRGPITRRESPLVSRLQRRYQAALGRILGMVRPALIATIGLVLAAVLVIPLLSWSLLPPFRDADVTVKWEGAPGTSHPEMYRLTSQASAELQKIPGVRTVAGQIGRAVLGDQVVGINSAELWISIDPSADREATETSIDRLVDGYPGFTGDANTYLSDTVQHVLAGSSDDIVVRVFGPAWDVLGAKAEEVRSALSTIGGTTVHSEPQIREPYVQ
ncbi:MAG: efflux RND transporter permease subunit, partial [Chloroflexota bacterium]|nr:efflux RND transporter permease subunit [Chloroflexota bacterium]